MLSKTLPQHPCSIHVGVRSVSVSAHAFPDPDPTRVCLPSLAVQMSRIHSTSKATVGLAAAAAAAATAATAAVIAVAVANGADATVADDPRPKGNCPACLRNKNDRCVKSVMTRIHEMCRWGMGVYLSGMTCRSRTGRLQQVPQESSRKWWPTSSSVPYHSLAGA